MPGFKFFDIAIFQVKKLFFRLLSSL